MFTREQVARGIETAKNLYGGSVFAEVSADQIIEAIQFEQTLEPNDKGEWSGCCC